MLKKGKQEYLKEKKGSGGGTKQSAATNDAGDNKMEIPSFETLKSVIERARKVYDKGQYAQCLEILSSQGGDGNMTKETAKTMMMCCENNKQVIFTAIESLELNSKCNKELGRLRVASEGLSSIIDVLEMDIGSNRSSGGDEMTRDVVRVVVRVLASRAVLYEEMERWGDALEDWTEVLSIVEKGGGGEGKVEMMKQRAVLGRGRAKKFVAETKT